MDQDHQQVIEPLNGVHGTCVPAEECTWLNGRCLRLPAD